MPEKTELTKIDKKMQNVVQELQKGNAEQKNNNKINKEEQKTRLSTWGSIKSGFEAFNISLENNAENKITWGSIGNELKETIGEWYKQTIEMDNLLGKTFRLGAAVWENVNKHLISNLKTAFSNITSGMREVLGPVAEAFDTVKNLVMSTFDFFKGMFVSIFGKVKPEDKIRNRLLQEVVDYFKSEEKEEDREGVTKKKMPKSLRMILLGLGIVIGAVVGAIMAPFRLLLGVLKKVKPIALVITKFFGKASIFGKIIAKASKFLGPLAAGFKIGFKVLGWPLTILLGVIDAIRASWAKYKEGGTVYEIIIAGIKGAFMGLFEAPVKIIGWIADWVLKKFGVKVEGGISSKIMDAISSIFDWVFKIPELITKAWEWTKSKFGVGKQKEFDPATDDPFDQRYQEKESKLKAASAERKRLEMKKINDEKIAREKIAREKIAREKIARENKQKSLDEQKKTNANLNQINQTTINNQTVVEQIPDEVDGSVANLHLLWGF